MKNVKLYEYQDLKEDKQKQVRGKLTDQIVKRELELLKEQLRREEITEEDYYNHLGCSKHYAKTTSWFVPSCYYEEHKDSIDAKVESRLQKSLFDNTGNIIHT